MDTILPAFAFIVANPVVGAMIAFVIFCYFGYLMERRCDTVPGLLGAILVVLLLE